MFIDKRPVPLPSVRRSGSQLQPHHAGTISAPPNGAEKAIDSRSINMSPNGVKVSTGPGLGPALLAL